jgi:hypothetical protein
MRYVGPEISEGGKYSYGLPRKSLLAINRLRFRGVVKDLIWGQVGVPSYQNGCYGLQ